MAKYPAFKAIIDAFKKNDILKFQMVTSPEAAPVGTDLWKLNQKGEKIEDAGCNQYMSKKNPYGIQKT